MDLCAFSVSLSVKNIEASREFYEKLGFTDVREIQRHLKSQGLDLLSEADESGNGPASLMLLDPDGNPILIDQHV